jgi:hypothetical protein
MRTVSSMYTDLILHTAKIYLSIETVSLIAQLKKFVYDGVFPVYLHWKSKRTTIYSTCLKKRRAFYMNECFICFEQNLLSYIRSYFSPCL